MGTAKSSDVFMTSPNNMCALKVMKYETFTSFVTSILELKLDQATMFEWQWHTQGFMTLPEYGELFKFLDLLARAVKNVAWEEQRKCQEPPPERPSQEAHMQPA